jgi:hypothetical protein
MMKTIQTMQVHTLAEVHRAAISSRQESPASAEVIVCSMPWCHFVKASDASCGTIEARRGSGEMLLSMITAN